MSLTASYCNAFPATGTGCVLLSVLGIVALAQF
jgi:hypothetical protein